MENNTLQNEITEQDENDRVIITHMHRKLDYWNVSIHKNWCIYKVPVYIFKGYEYFYEPLLMSIGPVYYRDPKLEPIEEVKWIYLNSFLQHPMNANRSLNPYIDYVRDKEEEIRKCYQQEIYLSTHEFVEIIVVDAAFLIYFFLSEILHSPFDVPSAGNNFKAALSYAVSNDLFRSENQIPYFVLKGIFDIAFGHIYPPITLIHATLTFIGSLNVGIPGCKAIKSIIEGNKITDESDIAHLLDLQWMCCCLSLNLPSRDQPIGLTNDRICYYPMTAKKLSDNGVKFEVNSKIDSPSQITFKKGKFMIPELVVHAGTEPYLRNLQHFEQCHYTENAYINDYVLFFDKLIDTVEDVQVLQEAGILINNLGSDKLAIRFFNNVPKNTVGHQFYYSEVSKKANKYASSSWNQWKALLRRRYFGHPWAAISVIAAIMLFVLTLLQTITGFTKK